MVELQSKSFSVRMFSALFFAATATAVFTFSEPAWSQQLATGVTKPIHDLTLSLPVAGRIEALKVKEGDRVKKGDILLHLDKNLEALEAKRRKLIVDDDSRVEEAKMREQILKEQLREARRLLETNSVSRKQVEDEELAYQSALAERKALEMSKRREQVDYELAQEALERRILRAPISGQIAKLEFRLGESVSPHEPVVHLVDVSRVQFTGNIAAVDSGQINVGDRVEVNFDMATAVTRVAKIIFISPITDAASGLVEVSAEFDNADGSLRPGIAGRMMQIVPEQAVSSN